MPYSAQDKENMHDYVYLKLFYFIFYWLKPVLPFHFSTGVHFSSLSKWQCSHGGAEPLMWITHQDAKQSWCLGWSSSPCVGTASTMESPVPSHLSFIYVPHYFCVCVFNLGCLIQFLKRLKKYSGFIEYVRFFFLDGLAKNWINCTFTLHIFEGNFYIFKENIKLSQKLFST